MLETDTERLSFNRKILQELSNHSGGHWKEVWCEPQPRYGEMVFGVLLFEDNNLKKTHQALCDVFARHVDDMKPLEAHLSYDKFTDDGFFCVAAIEGNNAVLSALENDSLDAPGYPFERSYCIYHAKDSKR